MLLAERSSYYYLVDFVSRLFISIYKSLGSNASITMGRLTNLIQFLDLNNCQAEKKILSYNIRIQNTALCYFDLLHEFMNFRKEDTLVLVEHSERLQDPKVI